VGCGRRCLCCSRWRLCGSAVVALRPRARSLWPKTAVLGHRRLCCSRRRLRGSVAFEPQPMAPFCSTRQRGLAIVVLAVCTTVSCPPHAAHHSGVLPPLSLLPTSTPLCSSSCCSRIAHQEAGHNREASHFQLHLIAARTTTANSNSHTIE
jgi:hypothetical protein